MAFRENTTGPIDKLITYNAILESLNSEWRVKDPIEIDKRGKNVGGLGIVLTLDQVEKIIPKFAKENDTTTFELMNATEYGFFRSGKISDLAKFIHKLDEKGTLPQSIMPRSRSRSRSPTKGAEERVGPNGKQRFGERRKKTRRRKSRRRRSRKPVY